MNVGATYHDGRTARPRRVVLRSDRVGERLLLTDTDAGTVIEAWAFDDIRELRDHGVPNALVVHRPAHEARLVIAGAAVTSDFRAMVPGLRRIHLDRAAIVRVLWWAGGAVAAMVLLLFVIIPGLADRMAQWLPPKSEQAFGRSVIRQASMLFARHGSEPFCTDPAADAALAALVRRLVPASDLPYPITVRVMDADTVNAFAVPGGQIILLRGLIDQAADGDEVAAVLAHEIGHVVARDPTRIALRAVGSAGLLGLVFGDLTGGAAISAVTEQLMRAGYTRDAEAKADDFAFAALARAGLPPGALAVFFERMKTAHGEASPLIRAFLSHPMLSRRIEAARAARQGTPGAPAFTPQGWAALRGICG